MTATVNVSSYFSDPDGDALTYSAASSDAAVAAVSITGSVLTLSGASAGSATVTVTARDPAGLTASQSFGVTVEAEQAMGVCDRTPQVRDEIVRIVGAATCTAVTEADLARILVLDLTGSGLQEHLASLQDGDFVGLSGLEMLWLKGNDLSSLPQGVFADLSSLDSLNLNDNTLTALPDGLFTDLSGLQKLYLYDNALATLPEPVFSGLSSLQLLGLGGNGLSSLPEGVFADLSSLQWLSLGGNELSSLPEEVFADLSSLQSLFLYDNALRTLPERVFGGLSGLQGLFLPGNELRALSEGLFAGLSNLQRLDLDNNPGSPFELVLEFERTDGAATAPPPASVRLTLAEGAPFAMTVPLSLQGGAASPASASLPAGSTEGSVSTVSRTVADQPTRVTAASLPAIPENFTGITLGSPAELILFDTGTGGVCARTPRVRDEIVRVTGAAACATVTDADLAGIRVLNLSGWLLEEELRLTSLREGDFAGLSSLESLDLDFNDLTSLPAQVFSGLSSLDTLDLENNALTALPEDVFADLSGLRSLNLGDNLLPSLPEHVFDGLSGLKSLGLYGNALTTLPERVFGGLPGLELLSLLGNNLASLPEGVFTGLASLQGLGLGENDLALLPEGLFQGLSSLQILDLDNNPGSPFELVLEFERTDGTATAPPPASLRLTLAEGAPFAMTVPLSVQGGSASPASASLPAGSTEGSVFTVTRTAADQPTSVTAASLPATPENFTGITLVSPAEFVLFNSGTAGVCERTLRVRDEIVRVTGAATCATVTEADLAGIRVLELSASGTQENITNLRDGDFAGLSRLDTLNLQNNTLTALPQEVFAGLSRLRVLRLDGNDLAALPDGIFAGLSSLDALIVGDNDLGALPDGVFSGLSNLRWLYLDGNDLVSLPGDVFAGLSSLRALDLGYNLLSSLPADALANLSSLGWLYLGGNELMSLPGGVFAGLSSLQELDLDNNPGSPFELVLEFERTDGVDTAAPPASVRLTVAEGAPFAMSVPLSVQGGAASPVSASLPAGATEGPVFTVTRSAAGQPTRITATSLPAIPEDFTGITLRAPAELVLFGTTGSAREVSASPSQDHNREGGSW